MSKKRSAATAELSKPAPSSSTTAAAASAGDAAPAPAQKKTKTIKKPAVVDKAQLAIGAKGRKVHGDMQGNRGERVAASQLEHEVAAQEHLQSKEHGVSYDEHADREDKTKAAATAIKLGHAAVPLSTKWINKHKVLVFCARGITLRGRHLMEDLKVLLPHSKKEVKLDRKDTLSVINEVAELRNCQSCIFFESRKKRDLFLWLSNTPNGPSAKFHVENVHTMDELRLTGNCLKGSRPLLSFDQAFDANPQMQLLKEMFTQSFGTPKGHPKSKPFFDHVLTFSVVDGRIWFRNFQIIEGDVKKNTETSLSEIGPRFTLQLIRIFDGSFGGRTIFENTDYVSPNAFRALLRKERGGKYKHRIQSDADATVRKKENKLVETELDTLFEG